MQCFKADKQLTKYREEEMQSKGKLGVKKEIKSDAEVCSQKYISLNYTVVQAGTLAADILAGLAAMSFCPCLIC